MAELNLNTGARQLITNRHLLWSGLVFLALVFGVLAAFVKPMMLIVGIIGITCVVLMFKYDYFGLIVYLLVFLLRPGETYPALANVRPELLVGAALSFLTLIKNKYKYGTFTIPDSRLNIDFLLILAAMAASFILSSCKDCTKNAIIDMVKLGVFYLMIILQVNSKKRMEIFIWLFLAINAKLAIDIMRGYFGGHAVIKGDLSRASGGNSTMDNFNGIAITMNALIPFAYFYMVHYKEVWKKLLMILMTGIFVYTMIITGSRGGFLGFLGILGCIWWFSKKKLAMGVVILMILVAGWSFLGDASKERYKSIFAENLDESSQGRVNAWMDGLALFAIRPLAGVGAGAFATARMENFGVFLSPHSLYIQVIAELGLFGIIVYFMFFRDIFRLNMRNVRDIRRFELPAEELSPLCKGIVVSAISLLITGLFAHSAYRYTWYFLAGITAASQHIVDNLRVAKEAGGIPDSPQNPAYLESKN